MGVGGQKATHLRGGEAGWRENQVPAALPYLLILFLDEFRSKQVGKVLQWVFDQEFHQHKLSLLGQSCPKVRYP